MAEMKVLSFVSLGERSTDTGRQVGRDVVDSSSAKLLLIVWIMS